MLKRIADTLKGTTEANSPVQSSAPASEAREGSGADAKWSAEKKAEDAGAKWRKTAEARGEVAVEIGGPKGLEPTRYGDWEKGGRCIDF
jgi:hypothetical protein